MTVVTHKQADIYIFIYTLPTTSRPCSEPRNNHQPATAKQTYTHPQNISSQLPPCL